MIEIYNSQIYEIVTDELVGEIDNLKEKIESLEEEKMKSLNRRKING